jgi:sec-independent protein translocase protein TatA
MTRLLFIGGGELMLVMFAVLLLFGSNKIPEVARMLGKGLREFKKATEETKKEINNETKDVKDDITNIKKDLSGS